ncbi:hypothetical protein EP7_001387 [Isosphaeraceae bacterium EP7]
MRRIVPIGLTLLGAIAAPASALAQSAATRSPAGHSAPTQAVTVVEGEAGHSHAHKHERGMFRKARPCIECQRAKLASQGIFVPPPPDALPARIPAGSVCTSCQQAAAAGGEVVTMVGMPIESSDEAAGHAVVGDLGHGQPTGNMGIAGAEPVPVGVVQTNYNAGAPAPYSVADRIDPLARGHAGMTRPQGPVPMNGPIPPAPTPASSGANARPRVLAHLFGFEGIGRAGREAREQKAREQHAKISYGNAGGPISELPASMVYGGR